ncbi:TetR/AcrR family transcriptional regulator [Hoeflea sp. TYP-13]|uniref:TetR/AcrR family transcriptional regulator n=1 Tax=Hoeflea sp. TYP-13 TaxID=3230023 RepID=UPI0034C5DF62
MAGKKSFEEGKALDQALVAFWHSGYEGTSFADLEAATGLKKSSLYNAFGDKAEIYRRCLDRFEDAYESALLEGLEKPGLRSVLEAYFEALFEHFEGSDVPCGSLATMGALASGRYEGDGGAFVKLQLDRLLTLLKRRFDRAVSDGELPDETDTDALASLFFVVSRGLAVLHSDERELAVLRQALAAAMAALDSPPLLKQHP